MPPFADALAELAALPGVVGVALVNTDGLPIDVRGPRLDPDALAALAATLFRHADSLGAALDGGDARTLMVELQAQLAVLARLDEATAAVVVLGAGQSAGDVLIRIRQLQQRGVLAR